MRFERTRPDGRVIEVRRNPVPGGGFVLIYSDITERKRAEEAIRRREMRPRRRCAICRRRRPAWSRPKKLASLGQLTAGIAHEIKNPLNFVNNFSALSAELTDELNDALKPVALDRKVREEVDELTGMLKDNLEKVVQHGKRADSIVKNMLLHSREGSGEHRLADINAIVDESLNLAYHGARAEKPTSMSRCSATFDAGGRHCGLFPQEITPRAAQSDLERILCRGQTQDAKPAMGFEPTLLATTKDLGDYDRDPHPRQRHRNTGRSKGEDVQSRSSQPSQPVKAPASVCR